MHDKELIDNKNENVEILRAVAILLVIFVHIRVILIFPSDLYSRLTGIFDGNVGVDLFFVISGFVITRSFSGSFFSSGAGKLSVVAAFWIRRIFRLMPTALVWLLLVVLYLFAVGFVWDGQQLKIRNLIPVGVAVANMSNVYSAYCTVHPNDASLCNIYYFYGHYWSLSFEQQFYVVLPFLFLLFRKKSLIVLMAALIAIQFFWMRPYWSYAWYFRVDGFCWGILLALLPITRGHIPYVDGILKKKMAGFAVSSVLIFLLPFLSCRLQGFGSNATAFGVGLLALISAGLVFMANRYEFSFGTWQPYRSVMLYIGSRSYSLYVTHLIVNEMVKHLWIVNTGNMQFWGLDRLWVNIIVVIGALTATIVLAELTYRFIEVRFRIMGKTIAEDFLKRRQKVLQHA